MRIRQSDQEAATDVAYLSQQEGAHRLDAVLTLDGIARDPAPVSQDAEFITPGQLATRFQVKLKTIQNRMSDGTITREDGLCRWRGIARFHWPTARQRFMKGLFGGGWRKAQTS
jgi:hypothetical protein